MLDVGEVRFTLSEDGVDGGAERDALFVADHIDASVRAQRDGIIVIVVVSVYSVVAGVCGPHQTAARGVQLGKKAAVTKVLAHISPGHRAEGPCRCGERAATGIAGHDGVAGCVYGDARRGIDGVFGPAQVRGVDERSGRRARRVELDQECWQLRIRIWSYIAT